MESDAASSFEEDLRALEKVAAPSAGSKV